MSIRGLSYQGPVIYRGLLPWICELDHQDHLRFVRPFPFSRHGDPIDIRQESRLAMRLIALNSQTFLAPNSITGPEEPAYNESDLYRGIQISAIVVLPEREQCYRAAPGG